MRGLRRQGIGGRFGSAQELHLQVSPRRLFVWFVKEQAASLKQKPFFSFALKSQLLYSPLFFSLPPMISRNSDLG